MVLTRLMGRGRKLRVSTARHSSDERVLERPCIEVMLPLVEPAKRGRQKW